MTGEREVPEDMRDWTEREEQEMIERAKAGDPQANYELSLWALQRAEEEPEETRWNRLAAKCLVQSAQAGYGPAQEKMESLLSRQRQPEATARQPAPKQPAPRAAAPAKTPRKTGTRRSAPRWTEPEQYDDDGGANATAAEFRSPTLLPREDDEHPEADRQTSRRGLRLPFSSWGDAQWKRMEIICIAICVALAILIAVMLITGRRGQAEQETPSAIPSAAAVEPAATPTPTPEPFPDQATRDAIAAADLQIYPDDLDYTDGPISAQVSVNTVPLKLRTGPNTTYSELAQMPDDTELTIYAKKNNWALVLYGETWGWCSTEYLSEN